MFLSLWLTTISNKSGRCNKCYHNSSYPTRRQSIIQIVLTTHQRKGMLFLLLFYDWQKCHFCVRMNVLSFIILKIAICVRVDSFCCLLSKNEIHNSVNATQPCNHSLDSIYHLHIWLSYHFNKSYVCGLKLTYQTQWHKGSIFPSMYVLNLTHISTKKTVLY